MKYSSFFVSLWSLLLTYVAQKSVFSPTRVQNVQLHFISCTLLENLKLCPKIQFSEKNNEIENLNIRAKNWWIIVILLEFEFWRQKLSFNNFQFLFIPIFGAKIQIIKATLAFKNSQKSFLFSAKIQIHNFEFYWNLNFWTQFEIQFLLITIFGAKIQII